jgi:hypothetical protein
MQMSNGSRRLLADGADGKKSNHCFPVILFTGTYAKASACSLLTWPAIRYLQHIPKKKSFQLSTFNRDILFMVELGI